MPRVATQRAQLRSMFGPAIQREASSEQDDLQMKTASGVLHREGPASAAAIQRKNLKQADWDTTWPW